MMAIREKKEPRFNFRKVVSIMLVFIMQFVYSGVFYSFGEYYALLVEDYNSTWVLIGFIGTSVSGFSNWVGPLSGRLVLDYGYETVIPISGVLLSVSFLLTSYTDEAWQLFFTYSLMFGCSCGILSHMTMIFLLDTLDEDEVGVGVAFSHIGAGLGYITLSFLAAYFTVDGDILTLDQLFRIYALFGVLVIVASLLSFLFLPRGMERRHVEDDEPVQQQQQQEHQQQQQQQQENTEDDGFDIDTNADTDTEADSTAVAPAVASNEVKAGWALMFSGDTSSLLLFLSNILVFTMAVIPFKFGIAFAVTATGNSNMYYYVPLGMGIATIASRFFFASLTDYVDAFSVNKMVQLGCLLSTAVLVVIPQTSTFWILFGLTFYGLFNTHFPLVMLRTVALLGNRNHHTNFGVQCVGVGIGYFIGGCIAGGVYEIDRSTFRYVFLTCVMFDLASIIFDEIAFPQYSWSFSCATTVTAESGSQEENSPLVEGSRGRNTDTDGKKKKHSANEFFCIF